MRRGFFFLAVFLMIGFMRFSAVAAETESFDTEEIQEFLNSLEMEDTAKLSFKEMMHAVMEGNLGDLFRQAAQSVRAELFEEIHTNRRLMAQILVLAFVGAVFSGFSGMFGSGHVSETGFYVVYLLAMTCMTASFFSSAGIAEAVTEKITEFMRVLMPAYFMAVAMAGGALTSASICGFTLGAIGVVQTLLSDLLIPLTKVYMMVVIAGNIYKEDMLSKLTELIAKTIQWTMRGMFGIILGFHLIQGMILPQADAVKNMSAVRLAESVPGIGGGLGAVSKLMLGSGVLIKNSVGAAAVVILLFLSAVPLLKLTVLTVLYYIVGAAMQPACDKRLVACMSGAAEGHGLLLKIVGYALALFALTIALLCGMTNAAWYAG